MRFFPLRRLLLCFAMVTAPAFARSLLLVSIDGMGADYLLRADELGLKIPHLRSLLREGAFARGVIGVVPTVTYPSHTTIVTGVAPATHRIYSNTTFDPEQANLGGWYWYAEDIHAPTLWDAAAKAGLVTASVNWPVTVGANISFLIPEVWRAGTPDDRKLVRALSTPGLLASLENKLGPYADELSTTLPNDRLRAEFAVAILREHHPGFMTVHLAALDHEEHASGPFSDPSKQILEATDELIGELREAAVAADPQAIVCVVSDHGFLPATHHVNFAAAFADAHLLHPSGHTSKWGAPTIDTWEAMPWVNGGSVAVLLRNPRDSALRDRTAQFLAKLAADPANGIERILSQPEIATLGGDPDAAFLLDMRSGYQADFALAAPLHRDTASGGTHGYLPRHPELRASFVIAGPAIAKGRDLGVIEMLQIAPTLAQALGISLPTAKGKALDLGAAQ